jgi:hypothetical protein
MDETYIKIKSSGAISIAGDKTGLTVATLADVSGLAISFTVAGLVLHGILL